MTADGTRGANTSVDSQKKSCFLARAWCMESWHISDEGGVGCSLLNNKQRLNQRVTCTVKQNETALTTQMSNTVSQKFQFASSVCVEIHVNSCYGVMYVSWCYSYNSYTDKIRKKSIATINQSASQWLSHSLTLCFISSLSLRAPCLSKSTSLSTAVHTTWLVVSAALINCRPLKSILSLVEERWWQEGRRSDGNWP